MSEPLRLMAVLAHPDDETLGFGGALARYSAEGVETHVLTATRGQRGRFGDGTTHPGPDALGLIREAELRAAARELGAHDVRFLDYMDGDVDKVDPREAVANIAAHLRRVRPQVVVTFAPDGAYGHPDHVAICQFATAAIVAAAMPGPDGTAAHAVSKLYYMVSNTKSWETYQGVFKRLVSKVDGVEREGVPWPDWEITTVVDTSNQWPRVWRAVQCHQSQIAIYARLGELTDEQQVTLWGTQRFYRALSLVNGGRAKESDLFEGVRAK
jgi:LmbE family N-acetylglucosaminyl deacetylase